MLDYHGCDHVWAGVVSRISTEVDQAFGRWSVRLFRMWHYEPERHLDHYLDETDSVAKQHIQQKKSWGFFSPNPLKLALIQIISLLLVTCLIFFILEVKLPEQILNVEKSKEKWAAVGVGIAVVFALMSKVESIVKMVGYSSDLFS